jgi:hypothetical protein
MLFTHVAGVVLYPVHMTRVWWYESESSLPQYLRQKQALIKEIESLQRSLEQTQASNFSQTQLRDENERLRSLLQRDKPSRIAARILARPNQMPYDVLQLDRGQMHGVPLHAPVYSGKDQVVGFVSHVGQYYSFVTLASSPDQTTTAYILGPDIYATAEGMGNGLLRVRVPQGVDVAEDNVVILPGAAASVFGAVSHIETSPSEPQKYAYVPMPTSIHTMRYVTVGDSALQPKSFQEAANAVEDVRQDFFQVDVPEGYQAGTSTASSSAVATSSDRNADL